MKWLLVLVGVLVALVVVVTIIGALLPKGHVARRTARYRQRPEVIWKAITDYDAFPAWRSDVESVEKLPGRDGLPAWREKSRHGEIPLEVTEAQPPTRLVTRIADPNLPFGGFWTYEITPLAEGGAQLTITENGEVYNPVFRFVSRFIMGHSASIEAYLRALGKKFGEDVTPQLVS